MEYEDFVVSVTPGGSGEIGLATSGPLQGDARGTSRFPFSPDEWAGLYAVLAEDPKAIPLAEPAVRALGTRLFAALFPESILRALERIETRLEMPRAEEPERRLRIRLQLDIREPEALRFASLPWELAFSLERGGFLFLGPKVSIARHLELQRGVRPSLHGNLRILIASAEPLGVARLDVETEIQAIREALDRVPQVELLPPLYRATAQSLRDALTENAPVHALHFLGHSDFDPESGDGSLILENARHQSMPLPAHRLANLLRDQESLRLVVLNACWSGRATDRPGLDPFSGLASALVRDGVPAIVAMQFPVRGSAAGAFSQKLYQRLAKNDPLDAAIAEGRLAIQTVAAEAGGSLVSWAIPALYARSQDGLLFAPGGDGNSGDRDGATDEIRRAIVRSSTLIRDRTRGFVGRRWLFDRIDAAWQGKESGYFVIRGEAGIGKTALIAQMTKRADVIYFFNQRSARSNTPEICHRSLCAQLIEAFGLKEKNLPSDLGENGNELLHLLEVCSDKLKKGEQALLLIDALDEADTRAEREGANVLFLPPMLPPGFFAVVTTRLEQSRFRFENVAEPFELLGDLPENRADAREFVYSYIDRPGLQAYVDEQALDPAALADSLVDKSDGNFMYLRYVLADLEEGTYRGRPVGELPAGLANYYDGHWQLMRSRYSAEWEQVHRPLIALLAVADEPLSISRLAELLDTQDVAKIRSTLEKWSPFLRDVRTEDPNGRQNIRVRLYHESFREHLEEKILTPDEVSDAIDRLLGLSRQA